MGDKPAVANSQLCRGLGHDWLLHLEYVLRCHCGIPRHGQPFHSLGLCLCPHAVPLPGPLYYAIIALLSIPWVLSFVPAYMVYNDFGLIDTFWALIIPRIVIGSIFGIFLLRAFFAGLPEEIFGAARIDGAGHWPLIFHITIPLSMTVIATLALLDFINSWNDFLWPFVSISSESRQMISVALYLLQSDTSGSGWGPLFAGYTIASIPLAILFFALGKFYIEGLVESGLKT